MTDIWMNWYSKDTFSNQSSPATIGKFTKTGKFRLHITSLNVIAPHARYKVPSSTHTLEARIRANGYFSYG